MHDPSTPIFLDGTWWVYATGRGLALRKSKDLTHWRESGPVFTEFPAWHREVVPGQDRVLWAPDVVRHKNQYRLYYSVSSFGKQTSAIGLATSPAIDPTDQAREWTDRGVVVRSDPSKEFNAIDPAILIDGKRQWMVFGSYWKGIFLLELDPETGLPPPGEEIFHRLAWHSSIEAAALLKRGGFYYLFVNWGACCRGVESTYEIRVGRARQVTGPYLDREGRDMQEGGGSLLLGTEGRQIGPGHASFVTRNGRTVMFYHYYDRDHRGLPTLGWKRLRWDRDGWPVPEK